MRNRGRSGLNRRQFLALAAAAAAMPCWAPGRTAAPDGGWRHLHLGQDHRGPEPGHDLGTGGLAPAHRCAVLQSPCRMGADGASSRRWRNPGPSAQDGKTWTFKLRRGVKFHNGRELSSDDVKFTYEKVIDPKMASGGRGYFLAVEGIETPDKDTVRIHTKTPTASLLAGLAGNWSAIVPRDEVEKRGDSPPDGDRDRPLHLAGMDAPEPSEGPAKPRLLG